MRASLVGIAALAAFLTYCFRQAAKSRAVKTEVKEDLRRWEGEGGNVPAVATPSPAAAPQFSYPGAGSEARH
jgi:hypothetical protein